MDDREPEHHRHRKDKRDEKESHSESDTTEDDEPTIVTTKQIEGIREKDKGGSRRVGFQGDDVNVTTTRALLESNLREDPEKPGTYSGYVRNPPLRKERD